MQDIRQEDVCRAANISEKDFYAVIQREQEGNESFYEFSQELGARLADTGEGARELFYNSIWRICYCFQLPAIIEPDIEVVRKEMQSATMLDGMIEQYEKKFDNLFSLIFSLANKAEEEEKITQEQGKIVFANLIWVIRLIEVASLKKASLH